MLRFWGSYRAFCKEPGPEKEVTGTPSPSNASCFCEAMGLARNEVQWHAKPLEGRRRRGLQRQGDFDYRQVLASL